MAMYIPLSRRRRNAALIALGTLIAGLIVGFIVGRLSATTASEAARDVRARGDELASHVAALTIEYDQAIGADQTAGGTDTIQGGVLDALDLVDSDLDALISDAPWIGNAQSENLHAATAAVRAAATSRVTATEFETVVGAAAKTIRAAFGVDT